MPSARKRKDIKPSKMGVLLLLSILCLFFTRNGFGQDYIPGKQQICYGNIPAGPAEQTSAKSFRTHTFDFGSGQVFKAHTNILSETPGAGFELSLNDFPDEAAIAFEHAVSIWQKSIHSSIPIRVQASWTFMGFNQLASTGARKLFRNFPGAIQADIWYPVALAEKIAGKELNEPTEADIEITINSNVEWYFGTDGKPAKNQFDLVTVVLHELAHGFGFLSSAETEEDKGKLRDENYLTIYDLLLENKNQQRLSVFPEQSEELYVELTGNGLYLYSPTAAEANNRRFPSVYAPNVFSPGSSISHLDGSSETGDSSPSLMIANFMPGEAFHEPDQVVLGVLADLGWENPQNYLSTLSVYPNPGKGIFTFKIPINISSLELKILDATGKEIAQFKKSKVRWPEQQLDLSAFPEGLYIAILTSPAGALKKRIIFQK